MSTAAAAAETKRRLKALRAKMREHDLDAYYVPSVDAHQSEYVPECWQRRQFISGFTGSVGDVLVFARAAGLWTDGRYFLQAEEQLAGSGIKLFKMGQPGVPKLEQHAAKKLARGQRLGVDPRLLSGAMQRRLEAALREAGVEAVLVEDNLVDAVWTDQPERPDAPLLAHDTRFSGQSTTAKLKRVRKAVAARGARAHVLTALDCIAWLFNVRSSDVPYNPFAIANAILTDKQALLFTDLRKVDKATARALGKQVELRPYEAFGDALDALREQGSGENPADARPVWLDSRTVNAWVAGKLGEAPALEEPSPIWLMKAKKNDTELHGMRAAHLRDGVAVVRFLAWLDRALAADERVTELSAAERLAAFRADGEHYRGESFNAISGYAAHGAIVHYAVTPESDVPLRRRGIFLIDSGGQYLDGTTDITRTVLLGDKSTREQRDRFTRVLKGHIAVARARFPKGTAGRQLDTLARHALWQAGLDYAHGTGHGVGCYLGVHEGPHAISPTRDLGEALEPGNVLSNEPGFYREGAYGIRIENLVVVELDDKLSNGNGRPFYRFEDLTLCPIDTRLVEPKLLTDDEHKWLDSYHKRVREALSPLLDAADSKWLRAATRRLPR